MGDTLYESVYESAYELCESSLLFLLLKNILKNIDFLFISVIQLFIKIFLDRITLTLLSINERTKLGYIPIRMTGKKMKIERNNFALQNKKEKKNPSKR